jgi:protein SCO1/2
VTPRPAVRGGFTLPLVIVAFAVPSLVAVLAVAASCSPADRAGDIQPRETEYRGVVLEPGPRPDFTLPDLDGNLYSFGRETRDKLALLFFGYTHCPDICPVHMAGIAAVLRDLPWDVSDRVAVVFVTTDPERDTPERLREWLGGFDAGFVGLRGDIEQVNRIQMEIGLPAAVLPSASERNGNYEVGHAAQVLAFAVDDLRLAYPFGTRQADWKHDLPLLAAGFAAEEPQ